MVEKLLVDTKPRAVINFAAKNHVYHSIHCPGDFKQTNIDGTFNLLQSVRDCWSDLPDSKNPLSASCTYLPTKSMMTKKNYIYLVVQYEKILSEISIVKISEKFDVLTERCAGLIVYDNSKCAQIEGESSLFHYHFSGENVGTAGAYRYALEYAKKRNIDWLVLLDQDTVIDEQQIKKIDQLMSRPIDANVGVRLPHIRQGSKHISPCNVDDFGGMKANGIKLPKRCQISGISSGAIVRIDLFMDIFKSMPRKLWLDYVDHWMYLACQRKGFRLEILDLTFEHELSINDLSSLSAIRIRSILEGERIYCKELGKKAYIAWFFRVGFRVVRNSLKDMKYLKKLFKAYVG